jgi:hypothetical protein
MTGTFVTQSFYIYSTYNGHVIKVREVRNRKINLRKQVNWLSSDNWSHVGFNKKVPGGNMSHVTYFRFAAT